jgi:hypothetical protein
MTQQEARAIRRQWINYLLHKRFLEGYTMTLSQVKDYIRAGERESFGYELAAYKGFQS